MIGFLTTAAAVFVLMEGVSYVMHRFVMHGVGWRLHADHHASRRTGFRAQRPVPGVVLARWPSPLFAIGTMVPAEPLFVAAGIGMTCYGLAYLYVHEVVHPRAAARCVAPPAGTCGGCGECTASTTCTTASPTGCCCRSCRTSCRCAGAARPPRPVRPCRQHARDPQPVVALRGDARRVDGHGVHGHRRPQPRRVPEREQRERSHGEPMTEFGPPGLALVADRAAADSREGRARLSKPPLKSAPASGSSRFHLGTASVVAIETTAALRRSARAGASGRRRAARQGRRCTR